MFRSNNAYIINWKKIEKLKKQKVDIYKEILKNVFCAFVGPVTGKWIFF